MNAVVTATGGAMKLYFTNTGGTARLNSAGSSATYIGNWLSIVLNLNGGAVDVTGKFYRLTAISA